MHFGFMKDTYLTKSRDEFMLACQAANLAPGTLRVYRDILTSFIGFIGDMTVKELEPDHVRMYIAALADRSDPRSLARHYAVVRTWIRWLYAQKLLTERAKSIAPRLRDLFLRRGAI